MEKDFLVDVSLTPGFGENMTLKPVILDEFPKVLSLITSKFLFLKIVYKLKL